MSYSSYQILIEIEPKTSRTSHIVKVGQILVKNMWMKVTLVLFLYGFYVTYALRPKLEKVSPYNRATPGYRLPQNVELTMQELVIQPFIDNSTFQGLDVIFGKFTEDTNTIVLHSKNLDIVFYGVNINKVDVSNTTELSFDVVKDFLILTLNEVALAGYEFVINFGYTGVLNANNEGFYRARYKDENGEDR